MNGATQIGLQALVPNAPCGVERLPLEGVSRERTQFLMHRVELKEKKMRDITLKL